MSTKRHVIVFAFLIGCSTALAQAPQDVEDGKPVRLGGGGVGWKYVDEAWFAKQSKDLLDIIKILYKGREAKVNDLETAQAKMEPDEQIERRIALIKATLSVRH